MNGVVKEDDRQEFYVRIYNEARRMTRLIEDIIRLSHLDEGGTDMKREPCDLYAIAGETVNSLKPEAEQIALTVSDTGIGIPPEHQPRIFERFYCVDKSRSKARGGTGLGLSIVKHAAQLHNATIDLSSSPSGATVTVAFPKPDA